MRIEEAVTVRAPRDRVWERLADLRSLPGFMSGVTRLEHAGGPRTGLGARYHLRLRVGSAHAGGLIEIVEFDPGWELAWSAVTGITHRGRWRVRDGSGGTRVTFRLIYSSPGFPVGLAVDAASAPLVRDLVRRSLRELKAQLESESFALPAPGAAERALRAVDDLRVLSAAGLLRPPGPARLLGLGSALARWGATPAAAYAAAAALSPDRAALIDEAGALTFREVERSSNAVARGLRELGLDHRAGLGLLARNHRGWVEATVAAWKLGARVVYLNTSFAGPELKQVVAREDVRVLVHDAEFAEAAAALPRRLPRVLAWEEGVVSGRTRSLEDLVEAEADAALPPPATQGRAVILTSGTTGAPKGAQRSLVTSLDPALALLSRIPLRAEETTVMAAPLFHAWGFAHFNLGLLLRSTLVLQRRFDPERTLDAVQRHGASALVAVPVMLQRILELPARTRRRYDTSSLRVVALSGSALPGDLATRFMDEFGEILYNLYGSTEVAWAAIAGPGELRQAPGTAGRPPRGTVVRIYREDGSPAEPGEPGAIYVGSELLFEGYTGGASKPSRDGLMATGDVGRFDADGLLFVEGREDDMIVSGGENVYPGEVEDVIARLTGVAEVAVIGVADRQFGQALRAFIVRRPGARLTEERVKAAVRGRLARYKVPRSVEFVRELPRNATGKIARRELAARGA